MTAPKTVSAPPAAAAAAPVAASAGAVSTTQIEPGHPLTLDLAYGGGLWVL